ncbi:MAG: DndE family protein [Bacteroidales bacterium]|jgi:DNA sulfur modification protein DndE|nr:DndE family protein [Bacteroidales bacterium]
MLFSQPIIKLAMQINIKTSENSQEIIRRLTPKLGDRTSENVIARIALAYSLQKGKIFTIDDFNSYDSKGKEYKELTLFDAKYRDFYVALICQHYGIYKTDESIPKYVKLHIDYGLELLDNIFDTNEYTFFDFLNEYIEKGIAHLTDLTVSLGHVKNNQQHIEKSYFSGLLKLEIGKKIDTNESIYFCPNDVEKYDNAHIAVAGNSGTGKTQFALDFVSQLYEKSNGQVNFIFLDFKGLKKDDVKKYEQFFNDTKTTFIDVPQDKFPINPLTFIDNVNEANKKMGIDKFVDIISKYDNLGQKQILNLRDACNEAFIDQKAGTYPTLEQINEKLKETYDKQDKLTKIMEDLSYYGIFEETRKNETDFLDKNVYLSLSGTLPNSIRFTSLFLIINYIYNSFMNMADSPEENHCKSLRYVILIDEAHNLFKEKKYQGILEVMLREIRSKGVSIVLLSQGIDEYNQKEFDFSSLCSTAFLLNINDKSNTKSMEKFLGLSGKDSTTMAQNMSKIQKGQAISNIKEFDKAKLFKANQYWERKNN